MSTTTPEGPERSGGAAPPEQEERPVPGGDRPAAASDGAGPDGAAADGRSGEGTSSAVRRSLAERFAASSAGVRAAAARTAPRQADGAGRTTPPRRPAASSRAPRNDRTTTAAGGSDSAGQTAVAGPRRVRLSLSRVDPWSVMKLAFLGSVAIGIGLVVAAAVVWSVLDSMHVFADIEELLVSIGSEDLVQLMSYVEFDRVISMATIIAVLDVLLLTALSTLGAFVYNLIAALVGGLHLTLTDD